MIFEINESNIQWKSETLYKEDIFVEEVHTDEKENEDPQ